MKRFKIKIATTMLTNSGSISVESEYGKGSKFTVVLPARKVMQENMILSNKIRNRNESVQVEFSDIG